jgi:transcriptional regulator with XRE-family HTH domain
MQSVIEKQGLKQSFLAKKVDATKSQMSRWISGGVTPSKRMQLLLCSAMKVDIMQVDGGYTVSSVTSQPSIIEEPNVPYLPIPSATATLEDLERMLELVESTVRIARASITELRKKS